jgi:transcription factor TFIIIB component B''
VFESSASRSVGIPVLEGASEMPSVRLSVPPMLVDDTETSVRPPPPPRIARGIPQLEDLTAGKEMAVDKDKGKGKEAAAELPAEAETAEEPTQETAGAASKKPRTRKTPAPRKRKASAPPPPTEAPAEGVRRSSRAKRQRVQEANAAEGAEDGVMEDVAEEEPYQDGDEDEDEDEYEQEEERPQNKTKAKAKPKPKSQEKKPKAPRKPRAPRKPKEPGEPQQRRGRRRAKTPEDAEDQKIEEDVIKMKDLCKDLKIGRKSKRGKELENTNWNEVIRRQMAQKTDLAERRERGEDVDETEEDRLERLASANTRRPAAAPQMRIVNGQMVLDEESLRVNRHDRDALAVDEMEIVEENMNARLVNSATWSKRVKGERWDEDSTDRFYESLSMFGTDFEMISKLFPGRSRREIKNKFNCEERKDPARITQSLKTRIAVGKFFFCFGSPAKGFCLLTMLPIFPDMTEYSQIANQQFPDPEDLEEELQQLRDDHEAEAEAQKEQAVLMERERQEQANQAMREAESGVVHEQSAASKRKKKGKKDNARSGEVVLSMSIEEYERERLRRLAEEED